MSADNLMNAAAVGGALATLIIGYYGCNIAEEFILSYMQRRRAPKPPPEPRIIFRVGPGPPNKTREDM